MKKDLRDKPFSMTNRVTIFVNDETRKKLEEIMEELTKVETLTGADGNDRSLYSYPTLGVVLREAISQYHSSGAYREQTTES